MADPDFQNIPPHVSALGNAGSAMRRLVGGGLLLVAVVAGLLVYGNREGGAAPESLVHSRAEFGGGVSAEAAGADDGPTELLVRAASAGATIHVDGDSVGTTPEWQGAVTEGERWVRIVTPAGMVLTDTLVLVRAGTQTALDVRPPGRRAEAMASGELPARIEPAAEATQTTGSVRVTSAPAGATVRIDGRSVGRTPLRMGNLQPGSHGVVVERRGYEPTALQVEVAAGADSEVAVSLRPAPPATAQPSPARPAPDVSAPAAATGIVEVLVRPWGRIVIDGVPRTQESDVLYRTSLPVGEHRIEALHPTLGSKTLTVRVTGSGRVRVEFDLATSDGK